MRKKILWVTLSGCLLLPLLGNIWFWKDDDGVRHYSNVAPSVEFPVEELEESQRVLKTIRKSSSRKQNFYVIKVFDGDTLQIIGMDLKFTVRLVGIDCPEMGRKNQPGQPFSRKATTFLSERVLGRNVALKSYGLGGYNRQLAEVFSEGINLNLELLKAGMAEVYQGRKPKDLDAAAYKDAEGYARKNRSGIWSLGRDYESPKQWRKAHPWK